MADNAYNLGKRMCEKLKELIPRQQFDIAIQAAIGAKIISRETIKAVRKPLITNKPDRKNSTSNNWIPFY